MDIDESATGARAKLSRARRSDSSACASAAIIGMGGDPEGSSRRGRDSLWRPLTPQIVENVRARWRSDGEDSSAASRWRSVVATDSTTGHVTYSVCRRWLESPVAMRYQPEYHAGVLLPAYQLGAVWFRP